MPIEKEDLDQIRALFSEMLEPIKTELSTGFNTAITGAMGKVRKDFTKENEGLSNTVKTTVEQLLSEALKPTEGSESSDPTPAPSDGTKDNGMLKDIVDKLKNLEAENAQLKGNFTKAQEMAEQERQKAIEMQVKTNFHNAVRERAVNPDHLLVALTNFGGVQMTDDGLFVEETDDWGAKKLVPILAKNEKGMDLVDRFLADPNYSHYAMPRPGGSPSGIPGTAAASGKSSPKYLTENATPEDISKAILENGLDAVLQDIA
jgi:hypothetical protein